MATSPEQRKHHEEEIRQTVDALPDLIVAEMNALEDKKQPLESSEEADFSKQNDRRLGQRNIHDGDIPGTLYNYSDEHHGKKKRLLFATVTVFMSIFLLFWGWNMRQEFVQLEQSDLFEGEIFDIARDDLDQLLQDFEDIENAVQGELPGEPEAAAVVSTSTEEEDLGRRMTEETGDEDVVSNTVRVDE